MLEYNKHNSQLYIPHLKEQYTKSETKNAYQNQNISEYDHEMPQ